MDMKQAMKERHMVRKYTDEPIPEDIVEKLNHRVRENNEQYGLSIKLMTNDDSAVPGVIKLILAKGVNNFFIMAGPDGADELCGYCGADLMLYAQTLGLNTWWVGGTYNRKGAQEKIEDAKPVGIIAVGYGQTQGVPHKTKTAEQVSSEKHHSGLRTALKQHSWHLPHWQNRHSPSKVKEKRYLSPAIMASLPVWIQVL